MLVNLQDFLDWGGDLNDINWNKTVANYFDENRHKKVVSFDKKGIKQEYVYNFTFQDGTTQEYAIGWFDVKVDWSLIKTYFIGLFESKKFVNKELTIIDFIKSQGNKWSTNCDDLFILKNQQLLVLFRKDNDDKIMVTRDVQKFPHQSTRPNMQCVWKDFNNKNLTEFKLYYKTELELC